MKKFLILLMLVITFAFSNDIVLTKEDVIVKDGITINKTTNQPLTGILIKDNYEWMEENLTVKGLFKNGKLEGVLKAYDKNEELRIEAPYSNGKREGIYKEYFEKNVLKMETPYKEGLKNGIEKVYEKGHLVETISYQNNLKEGQNKSYYTNGTLRGEGFYKNGHLEGIWKFYSENGNILDEAVYENGKQNGVFKSYYLNGQLKSEHYYKYGLTVGIFKEFLENGILKSESLYEDGERRWEKGYYESGKLKYETPYSKTKGTSYNVFPDGIEKWYYENGDLAVEIPYNRMKKEGVLSIYYSNGALATQVSFSNDKIVKGLMYTQDGQAVPMTNAHFHKLGMEDGRYWNPEIIVLNTSTQQNQGQKPSISTGSAFAISNDGYFVTNYHVIKNAKNVSVYADKKTHNAKVLVSDQANDLALLKVDIKSKAIPLSTKSIEKGSKVAAFGYPLLTLQGNELKTTFGHINALSGPAGDARYYQIDTPIQPGNSGGPLLNYKGEVVGIVSATLRQQDSAKSSGTISQNVNYAVKLDYLMPLIKQFNISTTGQYFGFENSAEELVKKVSESVVIVVSEN